MKEKVPEILAPSLCADDLFAFERRCKFTRRGVFEHDRVVKLRSATNRTESYSFYIDDSLILEDLF
jgi:hypothetical protein